MVLKLEVVVVPVSDGSRAKEFYEPDGKGWVLQEVKTRAPGR